MLARRRLVSGEQNWKLPVSTPRWQNHKLPQGLKPASLLALDGTTERRALPESFILAKQRLKAY